MMINGELGSEKVRKTALASFRPLLFGGVPEEHVSHDAKSGILVIRLIETDCHAEHRFLTQC